MVESFKPFPLNPTNLPPSSLAHSVKKLLTRGYLRSIVMLCVIFLEGLMAWLMEPIIFIGLLRGISFLSL